MPLNLALGPMGASAPGRDNKRLYYSLLGLLGLLGSIVGQDWIPVCGKVGEDRHTGTKTEGIE